MSSYLSRALHDLAPHTSSLITYFRPSKCINVKIKVGVALSSQNRSLVDCPSIAYTRFWRSLTERQDQKPESSHQILDWAPDGPRALHYLYKLVWQLVQWVVGPSSRTWLLTTLQSELKNNLQKMQSHCQHRPYAISCKHYPPIWYWRLRYPL